MSVNRPLPGESHETFKARRASYMWMWRQSRMPEVVPEPEPKRERFYQPLIPTRMVISGWFTDEHGNASRQLRGT